MAFLRNSFYSFRRIMEKSASSTLLEERIVGLVVEKHNLTEKELIKGIFAKNIQLCNKMMNGSEYLVTFCARIETALSQCVRVVGPIAELGNWNPEEGLLLQTSDIARPYWHSHSSIRVPKNFYLEFKLAVVANNHSVKWEPGQNRKAKITNDTLLSCSWAEPLTSTEHSKKNEVERKKSEALLEVDHSDDSVRLTLKSDDGFAKTNSLLFLKSILRLSASSQVLLLQGCGKTARFSTIEKDQIPETLYKASDTYLFTMDLEILKSLLVERVNNICLINQRAVEQQNLSIVQKCHSIVFTNFPALEAYLSFLKSQKICVFRYINARISLHKNRIQILQVCTNTVPPLVNESSALLIAHYTRTLVLCQKFASEILKVNQKYLDKLLPQNFLVVINGKSLTKETPIGDLMHKFPHICIVVESESDVEWISQQVSEKLSRIGLEKGYFRPAKHYKWNWQYLSQSNNLASIQKNIKTLGFKDLLKVERTEKQCLEVSSLSIRLSEMMLNYISTEIKKHPDYKSLQIVNAPNKLYIHRLTPVYWIDQLTKYLNTAGLIVVGQPLFPGILDAHHHAPCVGSVQDLLYCIHNKRF